MFDEVDRLREAPELVRLLSHYAELGTADRHVWQDRLMELDSVSAKELTRLHGELIAYDWVEQNTGTVILGKPGVVAGCYRITLKGLRALKWFHAGPDADFEEEMEEAKDQEPVEEKPRRKREPRTAKVVEASSALEQKLDEAAAPATILFPVPSGTVQAA